MIIFFAGYLAYHKSISYILGVMPWAKPGQKALWAERRKVFLVRNKENVWPSEKTRIPNWN